MLPPPDNIYVSADKTEVGKTVPFHSRLHPHSARRQTLYENSFKQMDSSDSFFYFCGENAYFYIIVRANVLIKTAVMRGVNSSRS